MATVGKIRGSGRPASFIFSLALFLELIAENEGEGTDHPKNKREKRY
jgi:hypothetical protein